ncbi:MAG: tRNA (guanosine(46)-N7)-methyltransferase TrmB [Methylophilales bacterium]|nr:tRNA (guanosine(46)-N7)-methyltransferase TrmB [Methylophilales bacterium]
MTDEDKKGRSIRSFVLRQGRISDAQQRAYDALMPCYAIPYKPELLDLMQVFGRHAPKILEIGFGMGSATAQIAAAMPHQDYLGVEVHTPGVGALMRLLDAGQLNNVRIIQHDAVEVLSYMIAENSLDGVHIFFPDPWPKKRHHKRRLIQASLLKLLVSRLKVGGYVHLATDWQEYAEWMLEVLSAEDKLQNTVESYAVKPDYRPETKFERRGLELGHGVWDIVFKRI